MGFHREAVTGVVLAGGRGQRMGGVDKGLQPFRGMPLALHALWRLQPQVGATLVNANRNLAAYEALGVPVCPDADASFEGPLAGMLAALQQCETPWLATVPCDTPFFPEDLVQRLGEAVTEHDGLIALAEAPDEAGQWRAQPVFSLVSASLAEDLAAALRAGERKIDRWMARHALVRVRFDDAGAFDNANTRDELHRLQTLGRP